MQDELIQEELIAFAQAAMQVESIQEELIAFTQTTILVIDSRQFLCII